MSRRTSTTRAYKSRCAGRAAGGERAPARRGPPEGGAVFRLGRTDPSPFPAGGGQRTPRSTCPRPDGDAATSEEQQTEAFLKAPAPSSQESGTRVLAPQETGPPPAFPRSAVTQPRCPRLAERGRRRETDAHLPAGRASTLWGTSPHLHPQPPVPHSSETPLPVPFRRGRPTTPPISRLCARSSPLRTGRGRGLGWIAWPRPHCHHPAAGSASPQGQL
ncbi:skin secretory protein xP2-like [Choloepus didactylus]|uniref:skin secretory protein xP2-like n=1 Tax=Choloepus didactylus TaxID=27675 RepID=UPI00189CDBCC|nr:skin secretory protein xP2-like [Choloepus didactylus]